MRQKEEQMEIACWCHLSRDFTGNDDQAKSRMDHAWKGGINILLPFIHGENDSWYRTNLDYPNNLDRFTRLLKLAKERKIEVHPVVLPITETGLSENERARRGYLSGSAEKELHKRQFCATWAETRDGGMKIISDIMENHQVDGIHLDAIRYLDTGRSLQSPCQCEACRRQYRELLGMDTVTAPDLKVPGILYKFLKFRGENILELVKRANQDVKSRGLKLSMAARSHYLGTPLPLPEDVLSRYFGSSLPENQDWGKWSSLVEGQDWVEWAHKGLMDFICPMNYSTDREFHRGRLAEQMALVGNSATIYDGIGRKSSVGEITPAEMVRQAEDALELGAGGITIFHFNAMGEEDFRELSAFRKANA